MRIYLVRHGHYQSSDRGWSEDPLLSTRGAEQAQSVGRYLLATHALPTTIICSPLARAVDTAERIMGELSAHPLPFIITPHFTPSATAIEMFAELLSYAPDSLLVVGHLPSIEGLALELCGACPLGFDHCTLMVIDYDTNLYRGTLIEARSVESMTDDLAYRSQ